MSIDWSRFKSIVQQHDEFLLTSHIRPDCDALGSELGMAGVLTALGKKVRIVNAHPTSPNLAFIDPDNKLELLGRDVTLEELVDIPVMIVLDTSAWAQLGEIAAALGQPGLAGESYEKARSLDPAAPRAGRGDRAPKEPAQIPPTN